MKNPNKVSNTQLKVLTLVTCLAGLSMGNQSCQTTAPAARILKMDVDVGTLSAQTVTLPDGEVVDFPYVVNSLFYREVMANSHFVISNPITTSSPTSSSSSSTTSSSSATTGSSTTGTTGTTATAQSSGGASLSEPSSDQKILLKYGFVKSTAEASSDLQIESQSVTALAANEASPTDSETCLYDLPQATLGGEVDSFALTGGGGISVGYTTSGASNTTTAGLGATLDYTASKLEMGFRSDDPLTANVIAAAEGVAVQSSIKAAVAFPAGGVPLGLNFFYNTAISDTISAAMDKGLASLVTQYESTLSTTGNWNDVWESRVVYDPQISDQDTTVAIRGGTRAGIQVGDEFAVTNMDYKWAGDPCTSLLQYKIPLSTTPNATIKIIDVGDNVAVGQVLSYSSDNKILSGAQVKIVQLYVAPAASPTPMPSATPGTSSN